MALLHYMRIAYAAVGYSRRTTRVVHVLPLNVEWTRLRNRGDYIRSLLQNESFLTHSTLVGFSRRGFRNGKWATLSIADRALFRCALEVARIRGRISNTKLMVQVLTIALKLTDGFQSHILRAGRTKATTMYKTYTEKGVFRWAPDTKRWLFDRNFIQYLGSLELNAP